MKKLMTMARQFRDDENGAAMVEYSILIGIIAVASIMIVIAIGAWVSGRFTELCTGLDAHPTGACAAAGGS
ncbi:Flp family type IVb pilin [Mesorhizobium sp.]|uniref:Flp family type IVb pilin n=1 Tax=Mesorhizobium sp. TaxID=1871066 RepID=UPI000FE3F2D9|nr:Flp family type IVb pilin [Mesorhizobium sp.]RWN54572.1 MAG: Flp family type IVb pilin [Mesorhizobium sp.]RWN74859.1 MAG: Flp family type IVb pilin [Mesorhizobium sp.]RWN78853.1 MAG: Flp family type IVb pilin [Mesorhizobium sp.]RWN89959.1 MAG: Flp family type IVb pilin [Mesorhizobium sp.]RWO13900.1 MAG: Flp family type IVb pilin [Mesorhizobium sp.]